MWEDPTESGDVIPWFRKTELSTCSALWGVNLGPWLGVTRERRKDRHNHTARLGSGGVCALWWGLVGCAPSAAVWWHVRPLMQWHLLLLQSGTSAWLLHAAQGKKGQSILLDQRTVVYNQQVSEPGVLGGVCSQLSRAVNIPEEGTEVADFLRGWSLGLCCAPVNNARFTQDFTPGSPLLAALSRQAFVSLLSWLWLWYV